MTKRQHRAQGLITGAHSKSPTAYSAVGFQQFARSERFRISEAPASQTRWASQDCLPSGPAFSLKLVVLQRYVVETAPFEGALLEFDRQAF
jgi:hypothetical protein